MGACCSASEAENKEMILKDLAKGKEMQQEACAVSIEAEFEMLENEIENSKLIPEVIQKVRASLGKFQFEIESDTTYFSVKHKDESISGEIYFGCWNTIEDNRCYKGYVIATGPAASFYEGHFIRDKKDGNGRLIKATGEYYEGGFSSDLYHGHGILHVPNKFHYEGNFNNGVMEGQANCRIVWEDTKKVYKGGFANGLPNGKGILCSPNGDQYDGEFKNGVIQGKGTQKFIDARIAEGYFVNGELDGEVILTVPGKSPVKTQWKSGKMIELNNTSSLSNGNAIKS